ncbi:MULTISPECIES: type II secretion system protein [unclassified Lebetimonas]|uniref:type II secretion system protein n=1 Tax=unclassified Lebetimonas TaxID=2648158 RepID=UPI000462E992|nr:MULTISPECIES: prepilin-type N-terminal cleavage/methylation domain-containing protein [unclassified Lebetimonas]
MVKRAFTLIEMIFVIVILAFIAIGSFNLISKLYKRNYIAKTESDFEYFSQQLADQLSIFLYNRIPLSVIGYNGNDFKYIGEIGENENYPVMEWIGELNDAKTGRNLSGFADLYASSKPNLKALDFNSSFVNDVLHNKYNTSNNLDSLTAVIFAGTFDEGGQEVLTDYKNAFGWHNHNHNYVFTISNYTQNGNNCFLSLNDTDGKRIYAKFYLADSAYALALGKDINKNATCIANLHIPDNELDNTLFLFYNYRPWKGDTFCADNNGNPEGNVTVLAQNVKGFKFKKVNSHLEMFFTFFKSRGDINISVSKQKVVF